MKVQKRNGLYQDVSFDKIQNRLNSLCNLYRKLENIDIPLITQKTCTGLYDKITTKELDILSSETAISLISKDPDYGNLAARIVISNHHKNTSGNFLENTKLLFENKILNETYNKLVYENIDKIIDHIDYTFDYKYDFFGFKTLERAYLLKIDEKIIERPQDLLMRVSLSLHRNNIDKALSCYNMLKNHDFIHATPTLFNSGTTREQFSSCFLLTMEEDSVEGIYNTLKDCALISQHSGGIGLSIHDIRPNGSKIVGTNGKSNGIVPMLRVFNDTARYIDQGGGKRNGSFSIYIEPWHGDIFEFLELKKNHGNELEKARDLFYALWIPDLFMKKVKNDEYWCLFSSTDCPGLSDTWGDEFDKLYFNYETEKKFIKRVKARDLWFNILTCQIETGTPYLLYKDSCNRKSNQQNLGTIKSSNLCTEIVEYSSPEETAVCNLASISLKSCLKYKNLEEEHFIIYSKPNCIYCKLAKKMCELLMLKHTVKPKEEILISDIETYGITFPKIFRNGNIFIGGYEEFEKYCAPTFDYEKLKNISKILTENLNNTIDFNHYPTDKTKLSNIRHRPIGIGVQGLANLFFELKLAFDSNEAKELNKRIFETIYYGALEKSCELAKEREIIIENFKILKENYNSGIYDNLLKSEKDNLLNEITNIKKNSYIFDEELNRDTYLGTYSSYIGCPIYDGVFQYDMWGVEITNDLHNWDKLKEDIKKYGIRNSLLAAPMPTASTSQILNNYECFEPVLTNIYSRRVLSGDYMVLNEYMVKDLKLLELWSLEVKDSIISNNGSIGHLDIPNFIKSRYKTSWEIKQKDLIDMSCDRGAFICQSQSLNLFQESPTFQKLTAMHLYSWNKGLKTGLYYLRTRPSCKPIQFTIQNNICESCSG
tara:strand:- start:376 stop:3024 length:2649 start_codon:yes stop_codon:yes gene_type:complete